MDRKIPFTKFTVFCVPFTLKCTVDMTVSFPNCEIPCPACKQVELPFVLRELAKNKPGVIFLKVDVDELPTVAKEWDVEAMPTFVFIKKGKVLVKIVGADKDGLQLAVEKHATAGA